MTSEPGPSIPETRRVSDGLISGTAWTGIHVAVSVPIAFLVNVLVARSLGVVDYGHLAILTMVLALATAGASMGVGAALMQFVTKASENSRHDRVARLVSGAQGYNLFVAAPIVTIVVAFVVDVPLPLLVLAVVFGIFGPALLQMGPILLATQHRSDKAAQIAMVSNMAIQLTVVMTVLVHASASAVWIARIAATGVLMVLPFLALSRTLRRAALHPTAPWSLPKAFWLFAIPTGVATLISQLVTDRVQVFFLEWLGDSIAVGLYALAFGLAAQILAPAQAAIGPLLPAFAALRERGDDHAREGLLRVTRVAAVLTSVVLAVGLPILGAFIPWIYGAEFIRSSDYFVVMGCAAAWAVVGSGSYASLMARLGGRSYLCVNLVALAAMAGVALATIPKWGAWGAVASMVVGVLARSLLMVALDVYHYELAIARVAFAFAPVGFATVVVLVVWFVVGVRMEEHVFVRAVAGAAMSSALFIVSLRISRAGLTREDCNSLLKAAPGPARRGLGALFRVLSRPTTMSHHFQK